MPETALQLEASGADADEVAAGTVSLTATESNMTSGGKSYWACRFPSVAIPHNAFVVASYLELWFTAASTMSASALIEAADNSAALEAAAKNISNRTLSKLIQAWTGSITTGAFNRSPDVSKAMNTVLSRAGWAYGNAMTFALQTGTAEKLIGSETEGTAANTSIASEALEAFQFTASATGTISTLRFHTPTSGEQKATSVVGVILADNAGTPGSVLGEATFASKPGEGAEIDITGFSVAVTSGTTYWLGLLPLGGLIRVKRSAAGGSANRVSTSPAKVKKGSEVTAWGANGEKGPMFISGRTAGANFTIDNYDHNSAHGAKLNAIWLPQPPSIQTAGALQRAATR